MTFNPFITALDVDLTAAADAPEGYRIATGPEVGIFAPPELAHLNHRKIWKKPLDSPEGQAAWEQSISPEVRMARRFKDACRNAVWDMRMNPDQGEGKAFFEAFHAKRRPLPPKQQKKLDEPESLPAELLAAVDARVKPEGFIPRGEVHRRETNEQLEARLKRQAEEKRTGIRLERAPSIILGR
ncbi:hypothetical protein [Aestuariivirga sp.]|uniref:hypothetical protein n=1 Tax=Aestuariivirga sp. TaxID=2650926 RepID=UPI00359440FA